MGTTSGNYNTGRLMVLAGVTTSSASREFDNHNYRGAHIGVNITAASGVTPILTVYVEGLDTESGVWYPLLVSSALSLSGFNRLTIYPGVESSPGASVSQVLPASWRVRYTVAGIGASITATIGACMLK